MVKKKYDEEKIKKAEAQWRLFASELKGLYEEANKLSKKGPATRISDLELSSVNNIIGLVRKFLKGDPFIDRLAEFVPAGENPEYREVVLILRQLIQGMNRVTPYQYAEIHIKD